MSLSTSIATRIFTATDLLRVDISSIQNDDDQREGFVLDSNSEIAKVYFREVWAFAGASIGADRGEGVGNDAINPAPASTAWVSVGLIIITLCLWSTLIAGNGRRAASQAAAAATLMDTRRTGGAMMGCGDPGAVRIQPREDMRTLVEGVGKALGPPNARDICVTCLVRKPLRSKVRRFFFYACWARVVFRQFHRTTSDIFHFYGSNQSRSGLSVDCTYTSVPPHVIFSPIKTSRGRILTCLRLAIDSFAQNISSVATALNLSSMNHS